MNNRAASGTDANATGLRKLCRDCRHFRPYEDGMGCARFGGEVDVVTGHTLERVESAYGQRESARPDDCGPTAQHWQRARWAALRRLFR